MNKDGGFTGVLEIKPVEFRLLGANKQNYLIDGVLTNVLTSVGASQEAAIVKLEKPLDFDRHIQADLQRIVALAEANENGNLSDGEYAARIDVVQDRLALVDTLNTEQQVKNYRILDYNVIPTKLFMAYCQIEIDDFIKSADIELQLNRKAQK